MGKPNGKAPPPVYLEMYLDYPGIGCGMRQFLVLRRGYKWTKLLCVATFETVELASSLFDNMTIRELPFKPTRVERRLRENARVYAARKNLLREAVRAVKGARL